MVGPRKRAAVRLATRLRTDKALALRLTGLPLREIGLQLGITRSRVSQMINAYLAEVRERSLYGAEQLLTIELARLDALQVALWPNRKSPKVASVIVNVLRRRHKLLGLDVRIPEYPVHQGAQTTDIGVSALDLSGLTGDELKTLEALLAKAETSQSPINKV